MRDCKNGNCTCLAPNVSKTMAAYTQPQPDSIEKVCIQDLVIEDLVNGLDNMGPDPQVARDIDARKAIGIERYGTVLTPFNGRDAMLDLYQEVLDGLNYAGQAIFEDPQNASKEEAYKIIYGLAIIVRRIRDGEL